MWALNYSGNKRITRLHFRDESGYSRVMVEGKSFVLPLHSVHSTLTWQYTLTFTSVSIQILLRARFGSFLILHPQCLTHGRHSVKTPAWTSFYLFCNINQFFRHDTSPTHPHQVLKTFLPCNNVPRESWLLPPHSLPQQASEQTGAGTAKHLLGR